MKYFLFIISVLSLLTIGACRNDFDDIVISNGELRFSTDSIHLDTLFTRVRSNTRSFTIRNTSDEDIVIPSIALERGVSSFYTLNINGLPGPDSGNTPESGKVFRNVEVFAKDSIFGFVETTLDFDLVENDLNENGAYTDRIIFESPNGNQFINLFAKINDATFIFNDPDNPTRDVKKITTQQRDDLGEFIVLDAYDLTGDELNITNEKAIVISGYAVVPSGEMLSIAAGSRIHFLENQNGDPTINRKSGLIIEDGGRLEINGGQNTNPENPEENLVVIEGARIDEDFDILPGQWDFIWLQKGATADIRNCIIKNAVTPILLEGNGDETSPNLMLNNVQIYNAQAAGIQATASNIDAFNVVIDQSGNNSLNIEEGGTYSFKHCTIANYFNFGFSGVAIGLNNTLRPESTTVDTNLDIEFLNCIIDGPGATEIRVTNSSNASFNLSFDNCLVKASRFNSDEPLLNINNSEVFNNCIFNEDADFKNTNLNQLFIGEDSAANGAASVGDNGNDIVDTVRSGTAPDIGAYESISFEEM